MNTDGTLTYAKQSHLLQRLFESLTQVPKPEDTIPLSGLKSFRAWSEFEYARCKNELELSLLPRYVLERARYHFVQPDGFLGRDLSQKLERFRPWQDVGQDSEISDISYLCALETARTERYRQLRSEEYGEWLREHDPKINYGGPYWEYFSQLLSENFEPNGFRFDQKKSMAGFPVISKPLSRGWDLCWSAESRRVLRNWPRHESPIVEKWTAFELRCFVCTDRFFGEVATSIGFQSAHFMILRLDRLVDGFGWAYSRINGLKELSLCLEAYNKLYSVFALKMEKTLAESLC